MGKAYDVVKVFEEEVAKWAGAKYGVAVESCTSAIFLCLKYEYPELDWEDNIPVAWIPKFTYPGVAMSIVNAGYRLGFTDGKWEGSYPILGTSIVDGALTFRKGMYVKKSLYCLSFHYKKHLPIGRGGMILTNDLKAVEWLRMARWDGRRADIPLNKDNATICGWNMYMTPDQASQGLTLFEAIRKKKLLDLKVKDQHYPNLSKWEVFR